MSWLVFLYGPAAVGKLTVARELAERTGFALFHNHRTVDLVGSVFEFGSEPFVRLREEIWLSVFREAAADDRSLIFTFHPEATVRPGFPRAAADAVAAAGGRTLFVALECAEAELERRVEAPSRADFGKLQSLERYRELRDAGAFAFPELPADLTLDTGALGPAEAAARIQRRLGA